MGCNNRGARMIEIVKAIQIVLDYIRESEMEGQIDPQDPWFPVYKHLEDLQIKAQEEQE